MECTVVEYIPRLIDAKLSDTLAAWPAALVVGPRACGKTTTAARLAASVARLDDPAVRRAFEADPEAGLLRLASPALIDEWQLVPETMPALKRILDSPGSAFSGRRYVLTGSVRSEFVSSSWAATGRLIRIEQFGLTMREATGHGRAGNFFDRVRADLQGEIAGSSTLRVGDYVGQALKGGFPELHYQQDETARRDWLDSYVEQLVRRDMIELGESRNPALLRRYLQALAANTAGVPADVSIYRHAGVNRATGVAYDALFEALYVTERIPAWHSNLVKRLAKSPKRVLIDPALAGPMLGIDAERVLDDSNLVGRLIETFVISQLRPEALTSAGSARLHHLRLDSGTREIDLIAEYGDGAVLAIEVKAATTVADRDARHLRWLGDTLGDRFVGGIMFYAGPQGYRLDDRLVVAPISAIWSPE